MPTRYWSLRLASLAVLGSALALLAGCGGAQARKAHHLEKGNAYLAAGNYEKARVEFQNALQITPMDPEARYDNGLVNEKLGKPRLAAQFYQGTIDVSADHLGARSHLARLYVFSGAPDRALDLIKPALQKHPDDSELLALRAAIHVQQKDLDDALTDAERAVQLDPANEDAVTALAGIYTSTKSSDKARELLEGAVKRLPASVDLRLVLAQIYSTGDRPADAERVLMDLVSLKPNDPSHRIRLAQYYAGHSQLDAAERVLREGIKAIPQDRPLKLSLIDFLSARRSREAAEKELQSMIATNPKDPELKFALAKLYESGRQADLAEKVYQDVISSEGLDEAGLTARDRLARSRLTVHGDVPGAQKLIAEVLAKSPRDNDALILRGDIELAQKDPKATIADLRAVLRDQPNSPPVLRTLALAHLANGEPAIAEETMRRAVEANPKDATLRLDLAGLLAQLGKPEQAKPVAAEVVKDEPTNVLALQTLFRVSAASHDYATAKSAADGVVAAQPKSALGYMYQGALAEEEKHYDEAVRLYAQAADLQPDELEPLKAQIQVLVAQKRLPDAMKRLDQVISAQPGEAFAPEMKGDLLLDQGHVDEAMVAYRLAIQRAPKWWAPYRGLAKVQFAAKSPEAALTTLRDAQPVVDKPDQLALQMALYYESVKRLDDAIREYESAVHTNPQSEVAANNLAMLLVTYKTDAASLDRAKALSARFSDSSNASFLDTYGWVLYKHGEAAASVPVLERVVAKAPDAPVALYHLGMAQSQAGSSTQARENLQRAVNSGTNFAGIDEARATLDKLAGLQAKDTPKS
jgi:tetratricopeptide (TPR) repeat protein